tara:strand:- start:1852 stop:3093 length:1242 start_codon:yes stop_codon:yes gene_type:complete
MWESTLKDFHDEAFKQEHTYHMSGMMSPVMRDKLRREITGRINFLWQNQRIDKNSSPYDVIKNIYETDPVLQDWNVAPLRDEGQRLNLLYPSKKFEAAKQSPEMVAKGSIFIANQTPDLIFGLNKELMSQEKYDEYKQRTIEKGLNAGLVDLNNPMVAPGLVAKMPRMNEQGQQISPEARLEQQILDDLMRGNAPYMYKALIPRTGGQEGYWIGVFWHPEGTSPTNAKLIGAMINKEGQKHVVSNEELLGASASDQILEYLTSWFFDYNHENVRNLYKEGVNPANREEGWGTAVTTEEFEKGKEDAWTSFASLRRGISKLTGDIGDLEFQYAIKPLYKMLEDKAKEVHGDKYVEGETFLDEEQSQDVLREFMDRFNRPFTFLQQLPGADWTVPAARFINNLWELDINLREIWN